MKVFLEFEKGIADLEGKIEELRQLAANPAASKDATAATPINLDEEIGRLRKKSDQLIAETYARLSPWQKTQVARHPGRPHFSDYVSRLVAEFTPLAGDRLFGEDRALVAGLGRFRGQPIAVRATVEDGVFSVHYCTHRIAAIDLRTASPSACGVVDNASALPTTPQAPLQQ